MITSPPRLRCVVLALLFASAIPALAQSDIYWTGAGSTSVFSDSANWNGGVVPGSLDSVVFDTGVSNTVVLTTSLNLGSSILLGSPATLSATNGAVLTLANQFSFNGVPSSTISTPLAGSGNVLLNTGNVVTLAGANTFSGGVQIAGTLNTLNLASASALGTGTFAISSGNNGIDNISGSALTLSTNNSLSITNGFTFLGTNSLNLGTGTTTLADNPLFNVAASTLTLGGVVSGPASGFGKNGAGTLVLSAANTYIGATLVNGGVLQIDTNGALGSSGSGTTVGAGGRLVLNSVNYTVAETLSLNGNGNGNGALVNSGTSTFAGQIVAATNASISAGSGNLTLTGGLVKDGTVLTLTGGGRIDVSGAGISGSSPNSDLVVDGTTVVISASSTYNGPTTVQNNGTLVANAAINGSGDVTVDAGSTLSGTSSITTGSGSYIYVNGSLIVGDSTLITPVASSLALSTSGGGATAMGAGSHAYFDLFQRGGDLSNTISAADYIDLTGTFNPTQGTLVLSNASSLTGFAVGDMWKLFDLTHGSLTGGFASVDYSSLGLSGGLAGNFNNSTGVFSIINAVPEPGRALLVMMGMAGVMLRRRQGGRDDV